MNISRKINLSIVYFTLLCVYYGFTDTPFMFPNFVLRCIAVALIALFIWCLCLNKYLKDQVIIIILLLIIAITTLYTSHNTGLLITIMSVIVASQDNFKKILKLIFTERLSINLFINLLSICGLIQNKITLSKDGEIVTKYGLGYDNPNRLACVIGMLILLYICIREDKLKLKNIIEIGAVIIATYYLTGTRSILYTLVPMFFILIYLKYFRRVGILTGIYNFVANYCLIVGALIGIGIPYLMSIGNSSIQKYLPTLNNIASQRFFYAALVMSQYPIKFFGGNVYFKSLTFYNYNVVDDGYVRLLYAYGILGFLLFMCFSILTIRKLISVNKPYWALPFIVCAIWGVVEDVLYSTNFNFAILFWGLFLQSEQLIRIKKVHTFSNINRAGKNS